jgi:hypothetical protein
LTAHETPLRVEDADAEIVAAIRVRSVRIFAR